MTPEPSTAQAADPSCLSCSNPSDKYLVPFRNLRNSIKHQSFAILHVNRTTIANRNRFDLMVKQNLYADPDHSQMDHRDPQHNTGIFTFSCKSYMEAGLVCYPLHSQSPVTNNLNILTGQTETRQIGLCV